MQKTKIARFFIALLFTVFFISTFINVYAVNDEIQGKATSVFALDTGNVSVSAQSAVLIEMDSGKVVYAKNANQQRAMASTTKIMTALIALEYGELESIATASKEAVSVIGSSMNLNAGEKVSLEHLLYGLMLPSGNDAANVIAEHISGGKDGFIMLMNAKVKEMGLTNTWFRNPSGLDADEHYTTAYELAMISRVALQNPTFVKIVGTRNITLDGENVRGLANHNKMLYLYKGTTGVKTGYTTNAGRCLVSSATRDGVTLIAVTLKAPNDWADHTNMLNYGFSMVKRQNLIEKNTKVATLDVISGLTETVDIMTVKQICDTTFDGTTKKLTVKYYLPQFLYAPVKKGQIVGRIDVLDEMGNVLYTSDLVTNSSAKVVQYEDKRNILEKIKEMFKN